MIRRYNNPIKAAEWRPRIAQWLRNKYVSPKKRNGLSAVCLPGPELLEVEHIYKKLGIGHVVCVEIDPDHYRRMRERRRELIREGGELPDIEIPKRPMDIREYLALARYQHDIVFLDFDGKSHLVVEECARTVARSNILPSEGGVFGVNVLGVRENIHQQLAMRARVGESLSIEQEKELMLAAITWDPQVRELLQDDCGVIRRKTPGPIKTGDGEGDLSEARGIFFTNLLLRSMFKGEGFDMLTAILLKDGFIRSRLSDNNDYALEYIRQNFELAHVDMDALTQRMMMLITEAAVIEIQDIREHIKSGLEHFIYYISTKKEVRIFGRNMKSDDILNYLIAKYIGPYLCKDMLSLYYRWGNSPMFTDIGYFISLQGFEKKILLELHPSEKKISPFIHKGDNITKDDILRIRRIGNELKMYLEKFKSLCANGRREELSLDASEEGVSLPALDSREVIERLVENDPMISTDDIFERFVVPGFNCNQVMSIISSKLKSMGLRMLAEKREERGKVRISASIILGASDEEIAEEFYVGLETVRYVRSQLGQGSYDENGEYPHLKPYIDLEVKAMEERGGLIHRKSRKAASMIHLCFSAWAKSRFNEYAGITAIEEPEWDYLEKADEELADASAARLSNIVSGFSEFEPYATKPFALFRIAGALRQMEPCESDLVLLGRVAQDSKRMMQELEAEISELYGRFVLASSWGCKIDIADSGRNVLLEHFGYMMIHRLASEKAGKA